MYLGIIFIFIYFFGQSSSYLDKKLHRKCEVEYFRVGTTLADIINSPSEIWNMEMRMHQNYIIKNLGFYNDFLANKEYYELRKANGWISGMENTKYRPLYDKWIYIYGDSTLRQVFEAFYKTANSNSLKDFKNLQIIFVTFYTLATMNYLKNNKEFKLWTLSNVKTK